MLQLLQSYRMWGVKAIQKQVVTHHEGSTKDEKCRVEVLFPFSKVQQNGILIDRPDLSHTKFAKLIRSVSCNQASILFRLLSGHVPLNTYLHRIKKSRFADLPPSCHQYRETVKCMRCEAHIEARQEMRESYVAVRAAAAAV